MVRLRAIFPWLIPPALALVAFAPVLGLWFVSDDFSHLTFNQRLPFPQPLLTFDQNNLFYRPLSTILTWNLGTALFGTNATPYHAVSLLLHALSAFLVARLGYVVSASRLTGLIAGALFAVYPLATEPIAWLAAQWDAYATACVLGAALGFAVAWRNNLLGRPARLPYLLGLLSAFLAVGMKESALPMPVTLPFVALAISMTAKDEARSTKEQYRNSPPGNRQPVTDYSLPPLAFRLSSFVPKALLWSLPYAAPTVLFVLVRLIGGGKIGGYQNAPTDFEHFAWDVLVSTFLTMLMPLNRAVFSKTLTQIVGLVMSVLFLGSLVFWGRQRWPVLLLSLVWWLAFLIPTLNLLDLVIADSNPSNITNRAYYLSLAAFCLALASLISAPLELARPRVQQVLGVALAAVMLAIIPTTWKQLEPWTQASRQTRHILTELDNMLPATNGAMLEVNTSDLPAEYKGAYVFWNGLDSAFLVFRRQHAVVNSVKNLSSQALPASLGDYVERWNLDFAFNPEDQLYYVGGLAGFTLNSAPPDSPGTHLWDFRSCGAEAQAVAATTQCQDAYTDILPSTDDPGLILSGANLDLSGARWLRLATAVRYPDVTTPQAAEWFWMGDGDSSWRQDRSASFRLSVDGQWHVYWTYIEAGQVGAHLTSLRFDPLNIQSDAQIAWIAATPIQK